MQQLLRIPGLLLIFLPAGAAWGVTDDDDSLIVEQGEVYRLQGERSYAREVRIDGRVEVSEGLLRLVAPTIVVGPSGIIDASGAGEEGGAAGTGDNRSDMGLGGQGEGGGADGQTSSNGNAGAGGGGAASYGGLGAEGGHGGDANDHGAQAGAGGVGGEAYGQEDGRTIQVGSGGGGAGANVAGYVPVQPGGRGGGAIWLEGTLVRIDGELAADGERGGEGGHSNSWNHGSGGGGGAGGGGILIDATEISLDGHLHANGGQGGDGGEGDDSDPNPGGNHHGSGGGGGGGGRIKLFALCREGRGTIEALGGRPGWGHNHDRPAGGLPGGAGTIYSEGDIQPDGCAGPPRIITGSPYSVGENQDLLLSAEGTRDPDQGDVIITWDLDLDGDYDDAVGWTATVHYDEDGDYSVGVHAVDDEGDSSTAEVIIHVHNLLPVIRSNPPLQAQEETLWRYDVDAVDPAGPEVDPVRLELEQAPVGMLIEGMSLLWTPTPEQALVGEFLVVLWAVDDDEGRSRQIFNIAVSWLDSDEDGMSDGWERQYGLDPNDPEDAQQDMDGDGLSNIEEFLAGSDPTRFGRPDPPIIYSPEPGGEVDRVTPILVVINGMDPDADPLSYQFELHGSPQLTELLMASSQLPEGEGETTSWQIVRSLEENSSYYWRARCSDGLLSSEWSDTGSFMVNALQEPPARVDLLAPQDGAPVGSASPILEVSGGEDPDDDPLVIHFQLFLDPGLSELAVERQDVAAGQHGTSWTVAPPLEEDTTYWWRARALDDTGLASPWSDARSFKVNQDNRPPPAPQQVAPSPGAEVQELRPALTVANVEDPDGDLVTYTFELDTRESFDGEGLFRADPVPPGEEGFTTVAPGRLDDDTRYFWRVRASDGLAEGAWATTTFLLSQENDPPAAPTPISPVGGQRVRTTTPTLEVGPASDPEGHPVAYLFELSPAPDLSADLLRSGRVEGDDSGAEWVTPVLDSEKTYYWRCQASDHLRAAGPYSAVANFQIPRAAAGSPPPTPTPTSPANRAVTGVRPELKVRAVQDPDGDPVQYIFRVARDAALEQEVVRSRSLSAEGEVAAWRPDDPLGRGRYFWQALATDGVKESRWSDARSFDVDPDFDEGGSNGGHGDTRSGGGGCHYLPQGPGAEGAGLLLLLLAIGLLGLRR